MSDDPLDVLEEAVGAMTPARWEIESCTRNVLFEEDEERRYGPYWTWELAEGQDSVLNGVFDEDPSANLAGIVLLRNLAPSLLAVVRAAEKQQEAYEHQRDCEEEGEGDCCCEIMHQAYLAHSAALAALYEAIGEQGG